MGDASNMKHFVLVHGACHGAWCWYKLKPRLESAGHRVTALDLAASGVNMKAIQDVETLNDYSEPLLEFLASLPSNEKVILVGHSLGGLSLALAMDKYPEKISLAVFLSALMPDTTHQPSYVLDQYFERSPPDWYLDSQFAPYSSTQKHLETFSIGPKYVASRLYQLSPIEDLELSKTLTRPGSIFLHDLSTTKSFSNAGYGSIARVFIVCNEDLGIPKEFQHWMIKNYLVKDVFEIEADHMAMFSKPQELCDRLSEIAHKYA
ncbi:Abhydrolase_6 domain-containing protein [Cephalotus follicularis]|uniref:(S)-hydroxynitrile lyase n=1 Tax=Cephalotus follicularis TaxID=3775 RepID=A0A1Q3D9C1_CEPFO|nr:Abhydrolase_6 domain-containing protein [Cephalotus follicularis]